MAVSKINAGVVNANPTLAFGATSQVGTVYGAPLQVTMPADPTAAVSENLLKINPRAGELRSGVPGTDAYPIRIQTYTDSNGYHLAVYAYNGTSASDYLGFDINSNGGVYFYVVENSTVKKSYTVQMS